MLLIKTMNLVVLSLKTMWIYWVEPCLSMFGNYIAPIITIRSEDVQNGHNSDLGRKPHQSCSIAELDIYVLSSA
jgi:hypothetical protein